MKKAEAEKIVKSFAVEWARDVWAPENPNEDPDEYQFTEWLRGRYPETLTFRAPVADPEYFIHLWFAVATKQSWKL